MPELQHELSALASHLGSRREPVLDAWRSAIKKDRTLTTAHALPRAQLNDHIPSLLATYEHKLDPARDQGRIGPAVTQDDPAAAHGLHRWQQGYNLEEVTRELGRLNECVVLELEDYGRAHPSVDPEVMPKARAIWAEMIGLETSKSIAEYFRLRQVEAVGHIQDLEQALEKVRELEQQRADLWHQAAHDLRGNLGVVVSATQGLTKGGAPPLIQEKFIRVLDRNVTSLRLLLDDVMDLARLQAGREPRDVSAVDVAALLAHLCDDLETLAEKRGLYIKYGGPSRFEVQGDAVKIRRIVQNLVLNAIKYTTEGGVTVSWGDSAGNDAKRWMFSVQDTGPGFDLGPGAPVVGALEEATNAARETESDIGKALPSKAQPSSGNAERARSNALRPEQGEGIGLSIVKRLAELLDASVEVQTNASTGTTFRVILPRSYED